MIFYDLDQGFKTDNPLDEINCSDALSENFSVWVFNRFTLSVSLIITNDIAFHVAVADWDLFVNDTRQIRASKNQQRSYSIYNVYCLLERKLSPAAMCLFIIFCFSLYAEHEHTLVIDAALLNQPNPRSIGALLGKRLHLVVINFDMCQ
jgi:hypothetical protein